MTSVSSTPPGKSPHFRSRVRADAPVPPRIAMALTAAVPEAGHPVVVELDPYESGLTALVRELLGARGRHLAIEPAPLRADGLRRRFPDIEVVTADPASLPGVLAGRGLGGSRRFRSHERRFRRMLSVHFEEVVAGRTVWTSLPPASVHHCRRPRELPLLPRVL